MTSSRLVDAAQSVDGDLFDEQLLALFSLDNRFFEQCFRGHGSSSNVSILTGVATGAGPNRVRLHA
jgi:hypothetical protein